MPPSMGTTTSGISILIVADNRADDGLLAEHGLSLLVEVGDHQLLFDTGQGTSLRHNAQRLGVPLYRTEWLVLSHGHYDHTGGLPVALEHARNALVYCHPAVTWPRTSIRGGTPKQIGMPAAATDALASLGPQRIRFVTEPTAILPDVGITGPIPRREGPGPNSVFFLDDSGRHPDPLEDDMALWLRAAGGLVVCCGCCHSGLSNTLEQAQRAAETSKVHAVIGGLHLAEASDRDIDRAASLLAHLDVALVVPCHCTGERATARLQKALGDRVTPGQAGMRLVLETASALYPAHPEPRKEL